MAQKLILLLEGSCLKAAVLQLEPDALQTLDSLYAFYRRQWWCIYYLYHFTFSMKIIKSALPLAKQFLQVTT